MTDIHNEVRDAVREGFKEVFMDTTFLEHFIDPRIGKVVIEKMAEKLDKTFGVDCTDHEERQETHQDMRWVRKMRIWTEGDEGAAAIEAFRKLMKVVDFAASSAVRGIVYFLFAGALALIAVGITTHKSVKALFGI